VFSQNPMLGPATSRPQRPCSRSVADEVLTAEVTKAPRKHVEVWSDGTSASGRLVSEATSEQQEAKRAWLDARASEVDVEILCDPIPASSALARADWLRRSVGVGSLQGSPDVPRVGQLLFDRKSARREHASQPSVLGDGMGKVHRNEGTAKMRSGVRRQLRERGAITDSDFLGGDYDLRPLLKSFQRLDLGSGDVEMGLAAQDGAPNCGRRHEVVASDVVLNVVCQEGMQSNLGAADKVVDNAGRDEPMLAVAEDLLPVPFLSDGLPASHKCLATVWVTDASRPVLKQCESLRRHGEFCGTHKTEDKRKHGVWDPPMHASLLGAKKALAMREAARRASAAMASGVCASAEPQGGGRRGKQKRKEKGR
jgi:hypothetical protein